jgi:hypothetical protein
VNATTNLKHQQALQVGVRMDELGCDELWSHRQRRAEKAGKPWCEHCGRAVDMATAWAVRTMWSGYVPVAVPNDFQLSDDEERWVLLGSACGPKFMGGKTFLVPASDVQDKLGVSK